MQPNPFAAFGAHHGRDAFVPMRPEEAIAAFISAMEAAGLEPSEPIGARLGNGDLVRFCVKGDRAGKANAWAVLHLDHGRPAGAFGSWKLGVSEKWRAEGVEPLSPAERRERAARHRVEKERREVERRSLQLKVAARCQASWDTFGPADPKHPYLVAKGISGEGARQGGNWLRIPMKDAAGVLWNVQRIAPDGLKLFEKGGRQEGLFCIIGEIGETVVIGEGFGTMSVVRRATGLPVVAAFTAGNLMTTALAIRAAHPQADIVLAADDDAHLVDHPKIKKNLGMIAAIDAANAVGGRVAMPPKEAE